MSAANILGNKPDLNDQTDPNLHMYTDLSAADILGFKADPKNQTGSNIQMDSDLTAADILSIKAETNQTDPNLHMDTPQTMHIKPEIKSNMPSTEENDSEKISHNQNLTRKGVEEFDEDAAIKSKNVGFKTIHALMKEARSIHQNRDIKIQDSDSIMMQEGGFMVGDQNIYSKQKDSAYIETRNQMINGPPFYDNENVDIEPVDSDFQTTQGETSVTERVDDSQTVVQSAELCEECNEAEETNEQEVVLLLSCEIFFQIFGDKETLKVHQKTHTQHDRYKYNNNKDMFDVHNEQKPYTCNVCDNGFNYNENLTAHKKTYCVKISYCDICHLPFSDNSKLVEHRITHMEECEHNCDVDGQEDNDENVKDRGSEKYKCDLCSETFIEGYEMAAHMLSHVNDKVIKCSTCSLTFRTKKLLAAHYKVEVEVKIYSCDMCDQIFDDHVKLVEHKKAHTQIGNICMICDQEFNNMDTMVQHVKTHKQRKYECEKCGIGFDELTHLALHMIEHSLQTAYKCKFCDEGFADKDTLLIHQQSHTYVKQYQCNICHKIYVHKSSVIKHMKTCKGPNRYKCKLCGKEFQDNISLSEHMIIHKAMHICVTCNKSFTTRKKFEKHICTGTGTPVEAVTPVVTVIAAGNIMPDDTGTPVEDITPITTVTAVSAINLTKTVTQAQSDILEMETATQHTSRHRPEKSGQPYNPGGGGGPS